jgi:hypothetical protein
MAILNTKFPTNLTEYPNSFKRQGSFPLEAYSVFYDILDEKTGAVTTTALKSAQDYAEKNPIAYVGQILAVVNDKKHKEVILFGDDNEIADYAKKAVYALRDAKVINGVDTVNFAPKATATRAEAAKIIYGLLRF